MSKQELIPPSKKGVPNLNQHQDFDKVLKKTFSRVYQSLIHKLLDLDISNSPVKLPSSFSRTKEKRPDFAIRVKQIGKEDHIVHVEFQTQNDENMHKREFGYYGDFLWEYDLEVIQYVIYLGNGEPTMKTEIKHRNMSFTYSTICLNKIDVNLFLDSDKPHEIVLAVLCKYDKKDAPKIIKQILEKLKSKAKNDRELHEYTTDLEILSGLRKLQSETKKQIDKMPIVYDLEKDLRFKEGKRKGRLEGKLEGKRESVVSLLKTKRFSTEEISQYLSVPISFVENIAKELNQKA